MFHLFYYVHLLLNEIFHSPSNVFECVKYDSKNKMSVENPFEFNKFLHSLV